MFNSVLNALRASVIICVVASAGIFAQPTPDLASIETEIATQNAKLSDVALDVKAREGLFQKIASLLNHAGEIWFSKGEYELATKAFVEADEMLKKYHASAYVRAKADLEDAERQLANFEKDPNPDTRPIRVNIGRTLVGAMLSAVISEAEYSGDTAVHRQSLERLGEISRAESNLSGEAESIEKLGQLEFENGNNDKAFELYQKALELRQKAGKKEYFSISYVAQAKWYLGEIDPALDAFQQIAELTRKVNAEPPVIKPGASNTLKQAIGLESSVVRSTLTQALMNIAQIRSSQGKYGLASGAFDEVQKIIDQMKQAEKDSDDEYRPIHIVSRAAVEANTARVRGRFLEAKGDQEGATKNYTEAADLFSQISGGSPSGAVAGLRSRLAIIYSDRGKFDEARANIREAMRIRSRLHQESGIAFALMQSSRIELAAKQTDAALKFARQAKAAALQLSLDDILAEANEVEADVLLARTKEPTSLAIEQAITGYRTAIESYRQTESGPFLVRALSSLGSAYERAGKVKESEAAYKEAISVAESIRASFASSVDSESYANRNDITAIYQRLVDLLVKQGRAEEALQYATRAQRSDLIDSVPKGEIKLAGKGGDALLAINLAERREQAASENLNNTRGAPAGDQVKKASLANAIGTARQDYALAIKRLEVEQPNLRFTVRPTDLLKLQATISPTEAIVSYLVTPERLYIFVVRRGAVAVRTVQITQNNLRSLVATTRESLKSFSEDFYELSSDADTGFATEKARADLRTDDQSEHYKKQLAPLKRSLSILNQKLIEPVNDLIADATTLKIIPNAELFLLPFSALVSSTDGKYLLEKHELIFLTAGDLITVPSQGLPGGSLVAFGDPTEANLDGAFEEVKAIQSVFPRSTLFTKDKATKAELFKLTSAKILHFATHGHIRNPLESSTIQLAHLPNLADPDLSYGEIYALPLQNSDMIVLSACETALGGVSGTEVGVFIEAFRTKTSTVAASLWSVDDFATRELMVAFYKNLAAGQARSTAMRAAQLKVLRDGRTKHPLFWAAFVLYGDGGSLSGTRPAKK